MTEILKPLLPSILLLMLATLLPESGRAQERITIHNATRAEGGMVDGEPVRKLLGEVRLQADQTIIEADSAYQYEERNLIQGFNIQIESENDIVWADTLYHNTLTGFSRLRGRVIVLSELNTLFSESVDFDRVLNVALFNTPVRFEDDRGTLLASDGYYFQNTDIAFFRGEVQLADSTQYLEADSLYMNRSTDFYRLFDNVYAEDFVEEITFSGDFLEADSSGHRLLAGDTWLMQVSEAERDTSHLTAGILHLTESDTIRYIDAYHDVEIWSPTFAALADTAHYRSDIEEFRLRSNPIAWQERIQLTGPYIEALLEDDQVKLLTSYTRPIAVQEDSLTGRLNQMTGDTLKAWFDEGQVDSIIVYDNSELIFHLKDDDEQPDGLIELIAAGPSTILFEDGELSDFRAEQNIEGSYLPEDPATIDRQLSGFRWDPDLKPERPVIRTPRLPAIPDERPFELPARYLRFLSEEHPDLFTTD